MAVKGESGIENKFGDDDFAGTIRETPILIGVVAKNFPRALKIFRRQLINLRDLTGKETFAQHQGALTLAACAQKRERFVNDVIGCKERFPVGGEKSGGALMVRVCWGDGGKPRARINEDHCPSFG